MCGPADRRGRPYGGTSAHCSGCGGACVEIRPQAPLGRSQYPHRLERAPRVPGLRERVLPRLVHGPVEVERLEISVRRDELDERIQRVVGSAPTILSICAVLSIRASSWQRAVAQRQRHERRRRLGLARREQRRDGLEAIDLAVEVHPARLRAAMGAAQALDREAQRWRVPHEGLRWDLILLVAGRAGRSIWLQECSAAASA